MPACPSYAIVGAGFSGVAVAVQLLRRLRGPAIVHLLNRSTRFARGLAYGTRSASHLLNVPAGRMGLDPDEPRGFVQFLASHGVAADDSDFVPRKFFGEYLEHELERAQLDAAPGVELRMVAGEVLDLQEYEGGVRLLLDRAEPLDVSEVILAIGNFAPLPPCGASPVWRGAAAINDPWRPQGLRDVPRDQAVLLVGTGLTAVDALLSLVDGGHTGPVTLLSPRGRLPHAHRDQHAPPPARSVPVPEAEVGARDLLRALRREVAAAAGEGHDWRDVLGGLRADTPAFWQRLDARGRAQFLRHLLPFWDTHRHRMAPAIARRLQEALARGQAEVLAGRLLALEPAADGQLRATWQPRGGAAPVARRFARIVNCTGPSTDLRRVGDALVVRMRETGSLAVDPHGLGLLVGDGYRVQRADGSLHARVRYVGPLLRAQLWEATAVPELRVHAAALARLVARAA